VAEADQQLRAVGLDQLRAGKVAVLMAAGGLSTRMGRRLRGELTIGPVTSRSIFRLHGEAIAAIQQRYAPTLPWLVLVSREVSQATQTAIEREDCFGAGDVRFIQQRSLPVLDEHDRPARRAAADPDEILTSPAGHGGMFEALHRSGELDLLMERGIEYLFYFQHPNVLEQVCDPVLLGYHHNDGAPFDVTTKAIARCHPDESRKMGRVVAVDGRTRIVEYWDLTDELLAAPASIGTHVWTVRFLDSCRAAGVTLPFHEVVHREPGCDAHFRKFEQWIFDLMEHARSAGLLITPREDHFAPVKTPDGIYSLASARHALDQRARKWLLSAGLGPGGDDVPVEISPLAALDEEELKSRASQCSISLQPMTCGEASAAPGSEPHHRGGMGLVVR
jgi:UDP-N-acetylglucosamine pyrophosphorylase